MDKFYQLVQKTPLECDDSLSKAFGCAIYLKREDLQAVRSFKIRGAYHKMLGLEEADLKRGVIAASAGNHAQGVALAARELGCSATIVMPTTTPGVKIQAVQDLGAEVVLHGDNYSEAAEHCKNLVAQTKKTFIHPFDDDDVIVGQGTVATEVLDILSDVTHIFVPVGGGGLLAGVVQATQAAGSSAKVIGVEPEDSAAMRLSLDAGARVTLDHVGVFADGTAVAQVGERTFELAKQAADVITVNDDELSDALANFVQTHRAILEPAGALSLAGMRLYHETQGFSSTDKVVAICSGANIDNARLSYVLRRAELASGHNTLLRIQLPEKPGALRTLCREVVNGHNITSFSYRKNSEQQHAHITIGLHVRNARDKKTIQSQLKRYNYRYADLSDNEMIKEHGVHPRGDAPDLAKECFYSIEFPDKPGALLELLTNLGETWNISLFHYGGSAGDTGRVLIGFEGAERTNLEKVLTRHAASFSPANDDVLIMYS